MPGDDRFADAVKPALEALLSDLQHTTEVLRRANLSDRYSASREDLEPVYQEQTRRANTRSVSQNYGLDNVEQLVNNYSAERDMDQRKNVEDEQNQRQTERPTVHSLFTQLKDLGCSRKSLGSSQAQSYSDVQGANSPSRDLYQPDSMALNNEFSSKHGISTIPKGDCAHCGKPIIGQVVIALGMMWHPEHYTCCECGSELGHRNFFERNGKAYCEEDYHNQFSPRCAECNGPIKDVRRCVTAVAKNFHIQCFVCAECGVEFGNDGFHEKNGRAYCRKDFFRLFAPKCNGCQNPITSNFITALGTQWHPDCFVCQMCGCSFDGGSFFDHNGQPLCEIHYHEKRGSLCHACRAPISGRCVTAIGHKYHPEHFRCTYCSKQLTKGTFKEVDKRPFCHKCYNMTFALS
uniref:LIM domain protein n=1 Tax=Heterorhabditis bacteriophora TaxID=37862 RepID=A0A1I7XGA8_HETBA